MEEEDVVMMAWVLIMQEYGLSMTLQQLQMKMEKSFKLGPPLSKMKFQKIVCGFGSNVNI